MFILYEHCGDFPAMAMMTRVSGKPIFLCQKNTMMIPVLSLLNQIISFLNPSKNWKKKHAIHY